MTEKSIQYWLIRSPYQHRTWDDVLMRNLFRLHGIRNPEAARNIGRMKVGDLALYYDNIESKAVFGILEISVKPYPDPTSNESCWTAIDAIPLKTFDPPVSLEAIKAASVMASCPLLTRPRLSVAELTPEHFQEVINLSLS
jgi:predicted RNA-binding protein with PUA-like domain